MSEWISVKDRLPEKMEYYLVYLQGNPEYNCLIEKSIYSKEHGGFIPTHGGQFHLPATHWMPLPNPPKEQA